MNILLVNGASYIGSHILIELLKKDSNVILVDEFKSKKVERISRVKRLTKKSFNFYSYSKDIYMEIFKKFNIEKVVFCLDPKDYFNESENGQPIFENFIYLLESMRKNNVHNLLFTSAMVDHGLDISGDYYKLQRSFLKLFQQFKDELKIVSLIYSMPIGGGYEGVIGQDFLNQRDVISSIARVILKREKYVLLSRQYQSVSSGDFEESFIDMDSCVKWNLKLLEDWSKEKSKAYHLINDKECSALELIENFEKICNCKIPYKWKNHSNLVNRNLFGDINLPIEELYCSTSVKDVCSDTYKWIKSHPYGYHSFID